jgi:hypothetical protein
MTLAKSLMTIKLTSSADRFAGHDGPLVQYKVHCLMQHVQSNTGSHWALPLGDFLLSIAPVATRAPAHETTTKTCTHFAGRFDGRGGAPVQYRVHCLMEETQGFTRSHWALSLGKYCSQY